jgi:antitoxin component YwqK of YwqJK toxin-antitoxin module
MEGTFRNDEEEGVWQSWYDTGKQKDIGSYKEGKMSGKWEGWYPNGVKNYEGTWSIVSAKSKFFEETAKLLPLEGVSYPTGQQGEMKTGTWKFWNEIGKPQQVVTYNSDGIMNGPSETYTPTGILESKGKYKLGKPEGDWEYYQANGAPLRTCSYKGGKLNGKSVTYGRNARPIEEAEYKDNKMNGIYIRYDEKTGKIDQKIEFQDGKVLKVIEGKLGN